MNATIENGPLSKDQVRFFEEEGYLVLKDLFAESDLQPVIDEISAEIDERTKAAIAAGKLSQTYDELDFEHRLAAITAETEEVFMGIVAGRLCGPGIFSLLCNPRLLDVAEQLCGPELIASSVYRLRPKIPGHYWGAVPWHQDSGYFEPFCDRYMIITVWIPLVDATPERGCMWVLRRGHKEGVAHHSASGMYLQIKEEDLPRGDRVCVPLRKGGALIMTNKTPHASFDNTSDVIRWSIDLRFQSANAPTNARMTPLPSESRPADAPVACFPPEADFLVRSRARPDEIVQSAEGFRQLRQSHKHLPMTNRWKHKFWEA